VHSGETGSNPLRCVIAVKPGLNVEEMSDCRGSRRGAKVASEIT